VDDRFDILLTGGTVVTVDVERRVIDGGPMHVEYRLTEMGRALEPTVRALKAWAHDWLC
jgi:DNA-binding HxlR family transcriptional regulator